MSNRLAELHRRLEIKSTISRITPGVVKVVPRPRHVWEASWGLGRALDYVVPGVVPALRQTKPNGCWATVTTMMLSWRRQESLTIKDAIGSIGQQYLDRYNA